MGCVGVHLKHRCPEAVSGPSEEATPRASAQKDLTQLESRAGDGRGAGVREEGGGKGGKAQKRERKRGRGMDDGQTDRPASGRSSGHMNVHQRVVEAQPLSTQEQMT